MRLRVYYFTFSSAFHFFPSKIIPFKGAAIYLFFQKYLFSNVMFKLKKNSHLFIITFSYCCIFHTLLNHILIGRLMASTD